MPQPTSPSEKTSRRMFVSAAACTAGWMIIPRHALGAGQVPPSEKLNVAGIGVGGMGSGDIRNMSGRGHNIVALCDVNQRAIEQNKKHYAQARVHQDFRKMLDEQKDIDAVMVATPDHLHAVVTMAALKAGKHVYCEKPLTHYVGEARAIGNFARTCKLATQMGNQGQASEAARVVQETIWAGTIGTVKEIHAWSNRKPDISPRGNPRPKDTPPVPDYLNWDLWVGPSPMRPYHPCYLPFSWRGWWDFGTGCLGDIACHELSTTFKCFKLGHPISIEASSSNWQLGDAVAKETAPVSSVTRWKFAPTENHGPLEITWYNGGIKPPRPDELESGVEFGTGDGVLYVGDKGKILRHRLIPESRQKEVGKPPVKLERSPGNYDEWIIACKGGKPAGANFADHAAHLSEVVLLGNIAIRANDKLEWDPEAMQFKNNKEANALVLPAYREGWSL